jgi:hypothetical protein
MSKKEREDVLDRLQTLEVLVRRCANEIVLLFEIIESWRFE